MVSGHADPGSLVTVNGFVVPLQGDRFSRNVSLSGGDNMIVVRAEDGAGNSVERRVSVALTLPGASPAVGLGLGEPEDDPGEAVRSGLLSGGFLACAAALLLKPTPSAPGLMGKRMSSSESERVSRWICRRSSINRPPLTSQTSWTPSANW